MHKNTNLRAHLEGLEYDKEFVNVPAAEETGVLPVFVHPYASTSSLKEKKHAKPPKPSVKLLSPIQSAKGSFSTHS